MKRQVLCLNDYIEDAICYWNRGNTYEATKHRDGNWSIRTNKDSIGKVGKDFLQDFTNNFIQTKYQWRYGENEVQEYYDTVINGKYLLVFRNKADENKNRWMCMIDFKMICNKREMDLLRSGKLDARRCSILTGTPSYLIPKVEFCFDNDVLG